MEEAVRIPLRARDGSVRAYVVVDAADAAWANQWRWSLNSDGYAVRTERKGGRQRKVRLHRELLGLVHGDGIEGDHKDRDRLNCRRLNLRALPKGANSQNQPSNIGTSSSYRGVSWNRRTRKWVATVKHGGKQIHLGYFEDEGHAAEVARLARLRLMPFTVEEEAVAS
jgi:hypothetical protein